jgi:2-hydroxychromene-2-carboxylate isomerase
VAYLAAERVNHVLDEVPEWVPVRLGDVAVFRCAEEEAAYREDVERAARAQGLQPMRWPDPFPADTEWAMLAATYAKQIGRAVAFSLAGFRQAFAGGRDLGERDNVLLAAAACEMHPAAVIKGAELRGTRERLEAATATARAAGVREVPALVTADGEVREVPLAATTAP